jgi:hypothetical protein
MILAGLRAGDCGDFLAKPCFKEKDIEGVGNADTLPVRALDSRPPCAVGNPLRIRGFKQARIYARSLNLLSGAEWKAFTMSGELPADISANPWNGYQDKSWAGMRDWPDTQPRP